MDKSQLSNGIWVFEKGCTNWYEEMNFNLDKLNGLLNRHNLIIRDENGQVVCIYNGSQDKDITLSPPQQDFATNEEILAIVNA